MMLNIQSQQWSNQGRNLEENYWGMGNKVVSGVARILVQGARARAWRTGSEVRGDKVIQK